MQVIGIDLSLTSTGLAVVNHSDLFGTTAAVARVTSDAPSTPRNPRTGKPTPPTLEQRHNRLQRIVGELREYCSAADLVVIEQPAFSRSTGSMHDRSGLWWLVVTKLRSLDLPVVEVTPPARAKYATGKGNAGKDAVLAAVVRRYVDVDVTGNDEADALVLAAMGARHLGHPIDDLPKTHLAALEAVRWPEEPAA